MIKERDKRVFILGAGSSLAHTNGLFPDINSFFIKATELNIKFENLKNYIIEWMGYDTSNKKNLKFNIEDIYTHIEIDIERYPNDIYLPVKRDRLKNIIKQVLFRLQSKLESLNNEYHKLANNLNKFDTIINFNWDLLLDNILGREIALKGYYSSATLETSNEVKYKNFLQMFTDFGYNDLSYLAVPLLQKPSSSPRDPIFTGPYYLKLHGSIDWHYCDNAGCANHQKIFPVLNPLKKYKCPICFEEMNLLLIPPVLRKDVRRYPSVRRLWNVATDELRCASEIIIWGYSLPPTDFYSNWLLRQARRSKFLQKLIIINPDKNIYDKFCNIFKDKIETENIFHFTDFNKSPYSKVA